MKNLKSNLIIIPILTILITFIAGIISQNVNLWFLPLIGGGVAVLGEIFYFRSMVDIGMCEAIVTFFFLNYTLPFNVINLGILLSIFTIMLILWIFGRNYLITSKIKKEIIGDKKDEYLREYEIQSTIEIVTDSLTAFLIAFVGSMIALYSYTNILIVSSLAVPLAVIFSALVFIVIYVIIVILPRYLKGQNTNI